MSNYTEKYGFEGDIHIFECDFCSKEYSTEGCFEDAIQEIKDEDWIIFNEQGDWVHFCSEKCCSKHKKEQLFKKLKK